MLSVPTLVVQFVLPFAHGIAIVPVVTSLNVQAEFGSGLATELQAVPAANCCCASLYSTKFAFPWRCPVFWFTNARIPAKLGVEAEVPPTPIKLNCTVLLQDVPVTASASQTA
jgi:hypothetical protein